MAQHILEKKYGINPEDFGNRLITARRQYALKQTDLGEWLNVSRSYISNIERGSNKPGLSLTRGIRTFFAEECNFVKTLDFWVDGVDFKALDMVKGVVSNQKENSDEVATLKMLIKDKEDIILLLKEKIASLQEQLKQSA